MRFFLLQRFFFFHSLSLEHCFVSKLLLNWGVDLTIAMALKFLMLLEVGTSRTEATSRVL